ncbi:hypothetical protein [Actinokineospora sp. NBRC 105648]|uniref:lipopolysaccharide biosynthesis protein n=1 Tax=Actinokineospora sp. NBRC 105648 TaxID=3032206 RepID=UPI0024A41D66|nr:hypothetical protein [Actinokineospora sp. NBRC 105648]GLZ40635.1 hypothetical protein Acsp05_42590 [Actinokineospora sp. NBRC 105648]
MSTEPEVATTVTGRSVGRISGAILIGSALGFAVVILTGRVFSPADYAVFMTFWGLLFGLGSALSPLEQELARVSAVATQNQAKISRDAVTALLVGLGAVAVVGLVPLVPAVSDRLFLGHYGLGVVVLVAGVAFAAQFAVRGLLIGNDQVGSYAGLIVVEAAVRPLLILAAVLAAVADLVPVAVAVAVGSFAWVLFVPKVRAHIDPALPGDPSGVVVRRMLMLLSSAALTASVITGYPAMVSLLAPGGDPNALGGLYAALGVARVPLLLFAAVQALAVPVVVRLSASPEGLRKLRRLLAAGTVGAVALGALGALVGYLVGPWLVDLVFGHKYVVADWAVAGLVWSSVIVAIVQLLAAVLVARVRPAQVLAIWAVVAVASALVLALGPGDTIARAVLGLVTGPTLGLLVAVGFVAKSDPRDISVQVAGPAAEPPR